MAAAFRPGLPEAATTTGDRPPFSFVGGHNDVDNVPFSGLAEAALTALRRDGRDMAYYNLGGSALGHEPLRQFVASSMTSRAGMATSLDEILITSGSLQALDLVNDLLLEPGDTVVVEQATYGGTLSRLAARGVQWVGVDLDDQGIIPESLAATLDGLADSGVKPKFLYTIPTVQNPTGTVLPLERRRAILDIVAEHGVAIFEDECYADLTWGCERPPTLRALDAGAGHVIYCGSFSKSIAPALRVGYLIADPPVIAQMLALKTDAGTGALEQLSLAEYAPANFDAHVENLMQALQVKCNAMVSAVEAEFGSVAEVRPPDGGIYIWVTFPEGTDTTALAPAAAAAGVEYTPGAGWSASEADGARRLRLCFGHVDVDTIQAGITALAQVFRDNTDLPLP